MNRRDFLRDVGLGAAAAVLSNYRNDIKKNFSTINN